MCYVECVFVILEDKVLILLMFIKSVDIKILKVLEENCRLITV